jgi:hypothetical protein
MIPQTSLRTALSDPQLLGKSLVGPSWQPWRSLLLAVMGESLEPAELEHFRRLTRRQNPPTERVREFFAAIGRRAGKTRACALLSVYLACLCKTTLAPGERGVVFYISQSRPQARFALEYAVAAMEESPLLRRLIKRRTAETLELTNKITLDVKTANFRSLRANRAWRDLRRNCILDG